MIRLLYSLFFLSGAAGLMYESVWARYLGLFVGHEAYAQVTVLVIFLGGMALGALLVSRAADRIAQPLARYAAIEIAVGAIGLVFHAVYAAATSWAYDEGFPALGEGLGSTVLKWAIAGGLILPQSILLGMTFPLMSAAVIRTRKQGSGRILSLLYFTNSLGAAVGVLVAGFLVVDLWGLPGVLNVAAALNIGVGAAAWALSRFLPSEAREAPRPADVASVTALERLLLMAAFVTAIASFCYEIDWIRMLSLVLGSATHSFELMLSAFILGLALGAFWIRRRVDRLQQPLLTLAMVQLAMGVLAVATLPAYASSFSWMTWLINATGPTGGGYAIFNVARYVLCLAVMLPATFCAGMTLPLITHVLLRARPSEAAIGRVYAANTFGSIVGAAGAAMFLLPALGLKGLLVAAGLLDIAVGIAILRAVPGRRPLPLAAAAASVVAVLMALALPLDHRVLTSGVFRRSRDIQATQVDYYADGRTATVSVTRWTGGFLSLATNGKVDASLPAEARASCEDRGPRLLVGDEVTQVLTGVIPLAFLHAPGDIAVVGMGSGVTTHILLASDRARSVTTIEIEPRMVDGARAFHPANRRTFEDSRSRIVFGDARAYFATSSRTFDLIVSEPSNPWVSGVSALFTTEFYHRVRRKLSETGVFLQWLQIYDLDDASVLRVLGAIDTVFSDWRVYQVGADDILIAAAPTSLPDEDWAGVARLPALAEDLCGPDAIGTETLETTLLADDELLAGAVMRTGGFNSDFRPVLDLQAERHRFQRASASGFLELGDRWFNLGRWLTGSPASPVPLPALSFQGLRRATERSLQTWQADTMAVAPTAEARRKRYEWRRWHSLLSDDAPPADWLSWTREFTDVSRVRHAATAGWVDSALFEAAAQFATRHQAPPEVSSVLALLRGVQGWDAVAVLDAAGRLSERAADDGWIDGRYLVESATVAALVSGRGRDAMAWAGLRGIGAERAAEDLHTRILAARLEALRAQP
jgi:predicted membrane-bound spermidine synthase